MILLRLFGGASLESGDKPISGRSAQRRRIALLALLALARRGLTREKLTGYLWAETDMDKARRLLSESLYVLRRELGEDAISVAGDELRLNPAAIECDVVAFEEAIERDEPERAAALYAGPFLDGFHVSDALELDRWIDGERHRLARAYARIVEKLAETATAEGRRDDAVGWWRRLAEMDPFSGRFAVGLMQALDAAGNRAAALQHAGIHRTLLREELDAEPDPAVASLAEQLRDSPDPTWGPAAAQTQPPASLPKSALSPPATFGPGDDEAARGSAHGPPVPPAPSMAGATVTFLFSDIEGSTNLLRRLGPKFGDLLQRHHSIIRDCLRRCNGREIDTAGDGFFIVFPRARDAVSAAIAIRDRFAAAEWPDGVAVRVRLGLHTGEPAPTGTGFFGLDVHRAARIAGLARGGQILLSSVTRSLIASDVPAGAILRDHGVHTLKDIEDPEHLWEIEPSSAASEPVALAGGGVARAFSTLPAGSSPPAEPRRAAAAGLEAGAAGGGAAVAAAPRTRLASRVLRPRNILVALALILLIVGAMFRDSLWPGAMAYTGAAAADDPGIRLLIVPFRCSSCRPDVDVLRDGLMHQLWFRLDGVGPISATSPDEVLRESERFLNTADVDRIARRFGATHVVRGLITETAGELTVSADLIGTTDPTRVGARGTLERADSIADVLAVELIAALIGGPGQQLAMEGLRALSSLDALRPWVLGEQEFAAARYAQAVEAFEDVVRVDPGFAHGHYRLSVAREWNFDFNEAHQSAARAVTNAANLTLRQRQPILAWDALLNGRVDEAYHLYERIRDTRTDLVEAYYGMGEIQVHFNTLHGRPIVAAREYFEEVLRLVTPVDHPAGARQPGYGDALHHLLEFEAADRNLAAYDSLLAAVDTTGPHYLAFEAVREFGWGEESDKSVMLRRLEAQLDELKVGTAAVRVAAHLKDFDGAHRIARIVAERNRASTAWQAGGRLLMAQFSFASGQLDLAFDEVNAAAPLEPDWPREIRGLFALPRFATLSTDELVRIREDIEQWSTSERNASLSAFFAIQALVHPYIRLYLLGMLDVRLGELDRAQTYANALRSPAGASPNSLSLKVALQLSLRAHIDAARGNTDHALTQLHSITPLLHAWIEQVGLSPFYSRAYDRLVIAELSREKAESSRRKEDWDEAVRWYRSLTEGYEILFAGPAHYRMAGIYRSLGMPDSAKVHQAEFDRLWAGADSAAVAGLSATRW